VEASFTKYPFKTAWRGILTHLLALAFLVGGVFFGIAGVMNLLKFASFVYAGLMVVLLFTSSDGLKPNVPPLISGIFFGAMIIILVYTGHFFVGLAWFISGLILGHLTDEYEKKMKENEAKMQARGATVALDQGTNESESPAESA
jgi:hypothetical protein